MDIFAERLKELRIQNRLTQREISQILNVKQQSYSRYELGTGQPSLETLCKIAEFYNVSVDYLLGITEI